LPCAPCPPLLLFIGTAVIGCGIALGNVLLPGLIKRDFSQHVARMTGAYSLTMGGAAALGSALVVPWRWPDSAGAARC
jgi:CP family cyanate transporter-like MFS transporter